MNTTCSVERLESALAGRLPSADESLLYQHLEECAACAASLECLAGGADWSREASALLKTDELDAAVPTREDWSPIDFTVEHLEPTDEPNLLGRLGGYDILEIIGHGGMGVVLKAFDRELKRCVAIKVLAPHLAQSSLARKRFAREAQAAAAVVHPNVLAIHQVQPNGRLPFLVMPFVAGESLAQRLSAQGSLDLKEILRIGMQAAAGLAAAHEQGLVHRDVKPANILLEKGIERAVLTDFGLARAADDVTLTRWGVIAGTPQYMSPEQARGESLDNRSDLFSLGCVLYEMATGVSPFRTDSMMATIRRLVDDAPQAMASLNPELPPWFIAIVDRLLEKDPTKRFNTAKEVSDLLEGCLAHIQQPASVPLPASLPVPVVQTSVRKFIGRYKGVLTMFAALAVGAFAMLMAANGSPEIAGEWSGGDEWGRVVLKQTNSGEYSGSYSATTGKQPGEIQLKWSRIESRFNGNWREGEDRFGELSVRLVDDEIRGALTTDAKSKINPATPGLADLTWIRAKATATTLADPKLLLEKKLLHAIEQQLSATANAPAKDSELIDYRGLSVDAAKDLLSAKIEIDSPRPRANSPHKDLWKEISKGSFTASHEGQGIWIVTGNDGLGSLQFKIQISSDPVAAPKIVFGSVIEREIPSGKACLNLVTGKLIPLPEFTLSADEVRKLKGDVFQPVIESDANALAILDVGILDLDATAWDKLSASGLEEKFAQEAAGKRASQRRSETRLPPGVYGFKTYDKTGILQVLGMSAGGVKVRYKLVQQARIILENHNSTARLQFRLVTDEKDTNAETLKRKDGKGEVRVSREVLLDENSVSSSSVLELESGWSVSVKFTEVGTKKFAEVTGANVGKQLAIVFDGKLLCEPRIMAAITGGSVHISGNFSAHEADALAKAITIAIQSATSKHSAAPAVVSDKLSEKSQKIVDALLANIDDLRIVLSLTPQDRPDRHDLLLSTNQGLDSPDFVLCPRVTKEQMQRALTLLAANGYFDRASGDFFQPKTSFRPTVPKKQPGYLLKIIGCENHGTEKWNGYFSEDLSQRENADLEVVQALLSVLDGEAAKAVRTILHELADASDKSAKYVATQAQVAQIDALVKNAPVTTNHLAELFEVVPGSTSEYRLRSDVVATPIKCNEKGESYFVQLGKVFYRPANKSYYLQWDGVGASTLHYYGPFYGELIQKLGLTLVPAAESEAKAVPARESNLSPERTRTFNLDTRVGRIACSPDGKLIAVANDGPTMIMLGNGRSKVADNWQPTVDVLDSETGKKRYSLNLTTKQEDAIHEETERAPIFKVTALAFSRDSKLLAVGTSIGQVKLFAAESVKLALDDVEGKNKDTHTPAKYRSLERAIGAVTTLAFSPDGSLLAVGGESFADVPLLQQDVEKEGESLAISTTMPGRLKLWEVQSGKLLHDLIGHSNEISAVAFSPDGKILASAGHWYDAKEAGHGVKLWNPASGELKRKIDVLDNGGARSVVFSPDSNLIAIGTQRFDTLKDTRSGGVMLVRVASGILDWSQTVSEWANPVVFTRSGEQVIVLSGGHALNILETKIGKMPYDIHAKQERWNALALVPQSDRLLIGGVDAEKRGIIAVWNLKKEIPQVRIPARYSATKEQVARVEILLHTSHTPITQENDPEVYELKPGAEAAKQYQLRSDVVKIPIDIPAAAGNDTRKREIYYQPTKRNYYLRWDGSGIKPQQCYGPYDDLRFHDFGLTPEFSNTEKKEAATEAQSAQFGQMSERVITDPAQATPAEREKRFLDLDEGDFVEESPKGDLSFSTGERRENHLVGWNLVAMEVSGPQWNARADEVRKTLADKKAESKSFLPYKSTGPTTYFFKTNFGSIGKLQLEQDANKPGTVTVRFHAVSPTPMFGGHPNDGLNENPEELGLQGDWEIVSIKGDSMYRWRMMKVGDSLRIPAKIRDLNAEPRYEDQYRVSDSKLPLQFDVTFWVVNLYATQHGIYKLDGDNLTMCVAPCKGARPTEFVAEPEKSSLFVLKRVTPAKPSAAESTR